MNNHDYITAACENLGKQPHELTHQNIYDEKLPLRLTCIRCGKKNLSVNVILFHNADAEKLTCFTCQEKKPCRACGGKGIVYVRNGGTDNEEICDGCNGEKFIKK